MSIELSKAKAELVMGNSQPMRELSVDNPVAIVLLNFAEEMLQEVLILEHLLESKSQDNTKELESLIRELRRENHQLKSEMFEFLPDGDFLRSTMPGNA